jgi:pyrroloquinoline quinone (PQQ) biosynthesis protein C
MSQLSTLFKTEIERFSDDLCSTHPLFISARNGEVPVEVVAEYLSSLLLLVRSTQVHLDIAHDTALSKGDEELADFFRGKSGEEQGHEVWAESDVALLGQRFSVSAPAPSAPVERLVAYLDDVVRTRPAHYLAYSVFAEYFTVLAGPSWVSALDQHCGIPVEALTTVTRHVELDRAHAAKGLEQVDFLLTPSRNGEAAVDTLHVSMDHIHEFCDHLQARSLLVQSSAPRDLETAKA